MWMTSYHKWWFSLQRRKFNRRLLDDLMGPYGKYFDLKDENVDEFIGLKITDTEDDMFIEPLLFDFDWC